eukprot:scaffold347_cov239-Pinguiococcus_pyrenoidosus.AAC.33
MFDVAEGPLYRGCVQPTYRSCRPGWPEWNGCADDPFPCCEDADPPRVVRKEGVGEWPRSVAVEVHRTACPGLATWSLIAAVVRFIVFEFHVPAKHRMRECLRGSMFMFKCRGQPEVDVTSDCRWRRLAASSFIDIQVRYADLSRVLEHFDGRWLVVFRVSCFVFRVSSFRLSSAPSSSSLRVLPYTQAPMLHTALQRPDGPLRTAS